MSDQSTASTRRPLFSLGQVVATPGALAAFAATGERITRYVAMHQCGEWGIAFHGCDATLGIWEQPIVTIYGCG